MGKVVPFTKMAGAGNDFIVVESPQGLNLKRLAQQVCDRTNGVGADGLLVLGPSRRSDYRMRIINADGSEAEMCGNGARCMAAYIVARKTPSKSLFGMETIAGEILAEAEGETARVRLSPPVDYRPSVAVRIRGRVIHVAYIDTGVPHVVVPVAGLKEIDVRGLGRLIRYHAKFKPRGANVNFVERLGPRLIEARTYERGVEDETKACGTGSVACALVTYLRDHPEEKNTKQARMNVRTAGGEILEVRFTVEEGCPGEVWLKGSAKFIARGDYFYR